jgi:cytidine deaminase
MTDKRRTRSVARRTSERERLLVAARAAALRAYAPYSGFRVGAAVLLETPSGLEVVTGANVENASYGLTLCAERTALAAACQRSATDERDPRVSKPPRIKAVAVACIDAAPNTAPQERMPCGACRQWLAELAPAAVYFVDGVERDLGLDDLLPMAFRLTTTE